MTQEEEEFNEDAKMIDHLEKPHVGACFCPSSSQQSDRDLRDTISQILVKNGMPTRQVAISEILQLMEKERGLGYSKGCAEEGIRCFDHAKEEREKILDFIDKNYLAYCREQNGMEYCKNCGLSKESLEELLR